MQLLALTIYRPTIHSNSRHYVIRQSRHWPTHSGAGVLGAVIRETGMFPSRLSSRESWCAQRYHSRAEADEPEQTHFSLDALSRLPL